MSRALLFTLAFFAGCVTASSHNHNAIEARLDVLEEQVQIWTDPDLLQWLVEDPTVTTLRDVTQRLQWAHPEIEEWGALE